MNLRLSLAVVAVAALAGLGWLALRPPAVTPAQTGAQFAAPAPDSSARGQAPAGAQSTASAAAVAPAQAGAQSPAAAQSRATLFNEYLQARQYRAIYDRLRASAEGETAEGRLVLYEILRNCANITEARRYTYRPPQAKREEFMAGLPVGDVQRDRRIAAYDEFTANRCQGFDGITISQSDLDRVLRDAAAAGDPRARAMAIEQELWQSRRAQGRDATTLTDAHIEDLKQAASTRDPEAIRVAGRVLSNTWADFALRVGPEQQPLEQRAFMNAWLVLACEYGQPCGADTPRMLQACAFQGHCNAQSFPDYLSYYSSSPHDSQLLVQYRALLRHAIETGDWSQLSVIRGLPTPSGRINFVPGPR